MSVTVALVTVIHYGLDSAYVRGSAAWGLFDEVLTALAARRPRQEALFGMPLDRGSLKLGGWQYLFLDTYDGSVESIVTEKTLEGLEQTLAANTLPAVVFSHQPLDGSRYPATLVWRRGVSLSAQLRCGSP